MIVPFFGELFLYPIPLELSHNYCSNKCAYCFANLNNPNRKAESGKVANQLKKFNQKDDLTSLLLQNGAAICISNKTDPFAVSNYRFAIPEIRTMIELGIPIAYHTRGGKPFDQFYKETDIPKSLFYISICQTDEEIRKRVEPGATSIARRWEMAQFLIRDGHQVVIGLNPYVHEWNKAETFIQNVIQAGVKNVIIQPIHLNSEQIRNMSAAEMEAMGTTVLENAKKRESPYYYGVQALVDRLLSLGINAYDTQHFNSSNIMEAWHTGLQGKTFKTIYDFYHWCLKHKKDNDPVYFEEFYEFMKPSFLDEEKPYTLYQYITSLDRRYRKTQQSGMSIKHKMTFRELCLNIWNDNEGAKNISRSEKFAMVGELENKVLSLEADENENLIYAFSNKGFDFRLVNPKNVNYD